MDQNNQDNQMPEHQQQQQQQQQEQPSMDDNQNHQLQLQQQQLQQLQLQQQMQMQQEQAQQQQQMQEQQGGQEEQQQMDEANATESNVEEFIEILEKHRKKCEVEGKYVEAEMAKNRISQIKAQQVQKAQDNLRSKQLSERLEVEQAHLIEFNQFNQLWDKKMQEFQQNAYELERQLIQKHERKMKELRDDLQNQISTVPKPSPELLNLRKIQESLAKQKDYAEAHKVQQRALQIEKQESHKFESIREQKIASKEAQLAQKQNIELQALKKRISTSIDEQRKSRAIELERLLQRYQNIKKELESQQQLERINKDTESKKILSSSRAFSGGMKGFGGKGMSSGKKGMTKSLADRRGFKSKKSESQESGISPPSAMLK